MRTAGLALAAMLATATSAVAQVRQADPAPTLSKFESRRLPPELVKQRIAEQLADLLVSPSERPAPGKPTRPLEDLWYSTTPRATGVPGVCQSDTVIFRFRPVDEASRPGDVPTSLVGVEATTGYRLVRPATARAAWARARGEGADRKPLDYPDAAACARLSTEEGQFTSANSAWQYLEVMSLLEEAQAALRDGKPLDIACDYEPYKAVDACKAQVLAFDPAKVAAIGPCGNVTLLKGQVCTRFDSWGDELDVYKQFVGGQWVAIRVQIPEPGIVIADMRRD